jgi:hypothetical protein
VPRPPAGLCDSCTQQKLIGTTRGSEFSMCLRARTDPAYPKYPRIPVAACPGWEPRDQAAAAAARASIS